MHDHQQGQPARDPYRPRGSRLDDELIGQFGRAGSAGRLDALGPEGVLGLQRSVGNAGVTALIEEQQEQRSPVHDVISSGGRPLDPDVRADMEGRLGHDFADVRVHDDAAAQASARAVNAHAYTVGSNIVFQRDKYDPGSHEGRVTLAHELTHVVQQRSGPVDGTSAPGGIKVSDPADRFEREAAAHAEDVMSAPAPVQTSVIGGPTGSAPAVQRAEGDEEEVQGSFADAPAVQRAEGEDEEEAVQGSFIDAPAVQRAEGEDEEEAVQGSFIDAPAVQRAEGEDEEETPA